MLNLELTKYIEKSFQAGIPLEKIREDLLESGWKVEDVDVVLSEVIRVHDVDVSGLRNVSFKKVMFDPKKGIREKFYSVWILFKQEVLYPQNKYFTKTPYLVYALALGLIGFATIGYSFSVSFLRDTGFLYNFILAVLILLTQVLVMYFVFLSLRQINYLNPKTGKKSNLIMRIFLGVISVALGVWGIFGTVVGLLSLIDSLGLNWIIFW